MNITKKRRKLARKFGRRSRCTTPAVGRVTPISAGGLREPVRERGLLLDLSGSRAGTGNTILPRLWRSLFYHARLSLQQQQRVDDGVIHDRGQREGQTARRAAVGISRQRH